MRRLEEGLKSWRKNQRYSQLQMSLELGISSKHISFLETGRAVPSREMLLRISTFLNAPKYEVNQALRLAGHAPAYHDLVEDAEDLQPVNDAIDRILENHMPYPALVLNRDWDLVRMNTTAKTLLDSFQAHSSNLLEIMMTPIARRFIQDWDTAAWGVLRRVRQELSLYTSFTSPKPGRLKSLEERLSQMLPEEESQPDINVLNATCFNLGELNLSFFSFFVEMSTVQDLRMSELRIELMFPADEATKAFYNAN